MPTSSFEHLIGAYLAGELDPATADEVRRYLEARPARQGYLAGIRASVRSEHLAMPPDLMAAHARFVAKLNAITSEFAIRQPAGRSAGSLGGFARRWIASAHATIGAVVGVAVSAAVIVGIIVVQTESVPGANSPTRVGMTGVTYATTTGQQTTVTLNDGTQVTLAPQTTVRVEIQQKRQTIFLDGEAYIDVIKPVANAPLVVRTGDVRTSVLGTRFFVRHYPSDPSVRVAVTDGKVSITSLRARTSSLVLAAGEVGDASDSTAPRRIREDITRHTSWLTGQLVFHRTPAPQVLAELGRWYGYEFRLTDSTLASQHLTVVLSTQSAETALSTLRTVLNVDLTIVGNVVTLTPRRTVGTPRWTPRQFPDVVATSTHEIRP